MIWRFYIDEDLFLALAALLRGRGFDAIHTRDAGHQGFVDPRQMLFAILQRRVLLTSNYDDFRKLHEAWRVWTDGNVAPGNHCVAEHKRYAGGIHGPTHRGLCA